MVVYEKARTRGSKFKAFRNNGGLLGAEHAEWQVYLNNPFLLHSSSKQNARVQMQKTL